MVLQSKINISADPFKDTKDQKKSRKRQRKSADDEEDMEVQNTSINHCYSLNVG